MSDAYKKAGVNIAAGNEAVERMKKHVQKTMRPEVLTGLGGFGGLFALNKDDYNDPVLVSGTDGVGTKLKIAFAMDRHDTIGIDAVAMCVNDIVVSGAEPLFFLDYLALGQLDPKKVEAIVQGIANGCEQAGCALIGGETAEMPGMYQDGEYDIAGFAVGIVDRDQIIDGSSITEGDVVIGLPSSGVHSNGFSLVRKLLLEDHGYQLTETVPELGMPLGDALLTPTKIYVKTVLDLLKSPIEIKGLVHITGGGFIENIPRVLPEGLGVDIQLGSWPIPPIFDLLTKVGQLTQDDLYSTFNMGIGLIAIIPAGEVEATRMLIEQFGEKAYVIGKVTNQAGQVTFSQGSGSD